MSTKATKIMRLFPDTMDRFNDYKQGKGTADKVLGNILDQIGVPR
jgi:hypothetical protein